MSTPKQRVTVTLDQELVDAGQQAVNAGEADSVSGWVSDALREKTQRDRRLRLLAAAIAEYEGEFGEITEDEIAAQQRTDRENATVLRGASRKAKTA